jgi:hypothetical protein
LDKVMFTVTRVVSEDEVKQGLGKGLSASIVSLRIVDNKKLVFVDFAIDTALDQLTANPPTIAGAKINAFRQKTRE